MGVKNAAFGAMQWGTSTVLSVMSGVLLDDTPDEMIRLLEWAMGRSLMTHELPEAQEKATEHWLVVVPGRRGTIVGNSVEPVDDESEILGWADRISSGTSALARLDVGRRAVEALGPSLLVILNARPQVVEPVVEPDAEPVPVEPPTVVVHHHEWVADDEILPTSPPARRYRCSCTMTRLVRDGDPLPESIRVDVTQDPPVAVGQTYPADVMDEIGNRLDRLEVQQVEMGAVMTRQCEMLDNVQHFLHGLSTNPALPASVRVAALDSRAEILEMLR